MGAINTQWWCGVWGMGSCVFVNVEQPADSLDAVLTWILVDI